MYFFQAVLLLKRDLRIYTAETMQEMITIKKRRYIPY